MMSQSQWPPVSVAVLLLILLLIVWEPTWFNLMKSNVTYGAGTAYGQQPAYWLGLGVGVLLTVLLNMSGAMPWRNTKKEDTESSVII